MSVSYSAPQVSRCVKATDLQVKVSQIIFRLKFPTPLQMILCLRYILEPQQIYLEKNTILITNLVEIISNTTALSVSKRNFLIALECTNLYCVTLEETNSKGLRGQLGLDF